MEEQKEITKEEYVRVISKDGKEFMVPVRILKHSPTLAKMIEGPFKESSHTFII